MKTRRPRSLGWPAFAAGIVALCVGAVACSGDDEPDSGSEAAPARSGDLSPTARMEFVTHFHQGLELARNFETERALVEFERCLTLRPDDPESRFHRARLLLGTSSRVAALAMLEEVAALDPPMLPARLLLADLYGTPGPLADPDKLKATLDSVRRVCGTLWEFDFELRRWLTMGSGPPPSIRLAHSPKADVEGPKISPLARLARSYSRRFDMGPPAKSWEADHDRSAEAERLCRGLVDEFPGLVGVCAEHASWLRYSQVRFDVVDRPGEPPHSSSIVLELAQQYFERALDACALDSMSAHHALVGLGHTARDMGDFDQAIQRYTRLLEQPGVSPRSQYEARFNLGLVHYRRGELKEARDHLRACAGARQDSLSTWLMALTQLIELPLRPERVTDEHRRTLGFVDIAAEAGVNKVDGAGPSAWCDVDGDGDLDLFVTGCDTFSILYRNDGDQFTDVSRAAGLENVASGFSATFADYDNDGDGDLYIGRNGWSGPAPNSLYRNRGDGTFEDVTVAAGVGHPGSTFVHGWSDFDRDGNLDLYLANGITNDGSTNVLYHNNGDGSFTDVTAKVGLTEAPGTQTIGFAIADYDRDGWPDLFVNSWRSRNRLYHNRGDGTFEEVAKAAGVAGEEHPYSGYVAFFADFDNDTWPDILLTKLARFRVVLQGMMADYEVDPESLSYATKYYHNEGDGTFTDRSVAAGLLSPHGTMGANIGDVNNDGFLDFYLGTGDPKMARLEPNAFYLNTGTGAFVDLTRFTGLGHIGKGHGITFADYDFDGDLDVYAPQGGFVHGDLWPNALYHNELGNRNNWLSVELVGSDSNRMGVGAQMTLTAGDLVVYREMTAGGAFGSSNSPYVHFGLGGREAIDRLEIEWPSKKRTTYIELPVNRRLRITEGEPEFTVSAPPAASSSHK